MNRIPWREGLAGGWAAFVFAVLPIFFAVALLSDPAQPELDWMYFILLSLLLLAALRDPQTLLAAHGQWTFHAFFLLLFSTTLAASLPAVSVAGQLLSVLSCYIWCSVFLSAQVLLRSMTDVHAVLRWLRVVGAATAISVWASYALAANFETTFGEVVNAFGEFRAFGPFGDQVGFILVLFLVWAFARGAWLQLAVHAVAILMTGTRGAIFAGLVGIAWVTSVQFRQKGSLRQLLAVAGMVIGSAFSWQIAQDPGFRFRSESIWLTAQDRLDAVALGAQVFLENPLGGVGFGGFREAVRTTGTVGRFSEGDDLERATFTTTNQYVQTATDGGVFALAGLVAFGFVIVYNCRRAWHSAPEPGRTDLVAVEGYLVAILLGNQTAVWLLPNSSTAYFVLLSAALAARTRSLQRKSKRSQAQSPVTVAQHRA